MTAHERTAGTNGASPLEASEERLRLAVAATGLGVFDWDLDTDEVIVNARFREMFGLPPGDTVIGAAMMGGVVHPDDRAFVEANIGAALDPRSSGTYQFEHRAVTPAGEIRLLTFGQAFFAGDGDARRAVRVIGNDLDITERKQAEAERELAHRQLQDQAVELEMQAEELQATAAHLEEQIQDVERARAAAAASEARYRSLFESIDEGFCVVEVLFDEDGMPVDYRFVEVNAAFVEQSGLVNAVGRTARELVPGLEQRWIDTYGRVATTGESTRFQQGSDVMGRWFDVFAFRTGRPEERCVAVLFKDVSAAHAAARERELLLAQAHAAQRAAEEANKAKTAFLSAMSHELRTPLNAIGGYAELMLIGVRGPVTEAQRADLERLLRANQHMGGLVTTLLDFARIEAGQVDYHIEDVRLGPVLQDVEALVGPQVAAKGLAYDHDGCGPETPDKPHVVRADAEKLRQILLNLLSNAVKFTDARGRVSVSCEHDAAAGVVRVKVADTGRGIPAEQLGRIFEPFVQIDRHRTHASQQGVGLGLAISRDLARGMGGDLSIQSEPGVGSTLTLTLPRGGAPSA